MKKSIALLLALLTLMSVLVVPAWADEVPNGEYATDYIKYGDGDLNQVIAASDALLALQKVVGKADLTQHQIAVLDTDGNQVVAAADALLILQFVVGKIQVFPAGEYYIINSGTQDPPPEPTGNYILDYDKSNSIY